MLNFFSPDGNESVAYDMLMEQGWKLEILEPEEAKKRWVVSIRGVMKASYHELAWPDHLWVQWTFHDIRPQGPRYALVRYGSTNELFLHIDRETYYPWSVRMNQIALEAFHQYGTILEYTEPTQLQLLPAPEPVPEEQ